MWAFLQSEYFWFNALALMINAMVVIVLYCKRYKSRGIGVAILVETLGFVLGAKLLDWVANPQAYVAAMEAGGGARLWTGGYTFIGGALGGVLALLLWVYFRKLDAARIFDVVLPNILLIYGIAKVGCFLNGCCGGRSVNDVVIPVQIIESILSLMLYLVVVFAKRNRILLTCACFAMMRFSTEFLRFSSVEHWLSLSQVLCLAILLGCVIYEWKAALGRAAIGATRQRELD